MRKALLSSVSASVLGLGLLTPAVLAPANAIGIGDFEVSITSMSFDASSIDSSRFSKPDGSCTIDGTPIDDPFSGKPIPMSNNAEFSCTMKSDQSMPEVTLSGSVTQKSTSLSGTIAIKCTIRMLHENWFKVKGMSDTELDWWVSEEGYRSCNFEVDVKGSTLTGTLEETVKGRVERATAVRIDCPADVLSMFGPMSSVTGGPEIICAKSKSVSSATVTGGTGVFAGMTGSGSYDAEQITPFIIPISLKSGPPPTDPNEGLNPGSVDCINSPELCVQGPCPPEAGAPAGATCLTPKVSQLRVAARSTGMGTKADLSVNLKKGGTKPRTVVPAMDSSGKRTLGTLPGSTTPAKFTFATAPSAKCAVSGKAKGGPVALGSVKADASGAAETKLTAAVLKKKLKTKTGTSVTLIASCASGKVKLPKSSTKVTLG